VHLKKVSILSESFPTKDCYPFNLQTFHETRDIEFNTPVTFFIGENGTGKSTLLKAIAVKCNIPIWKEIDRAQYQFNRFAEDLFKYIDIEWTEGPVPGSYFASEIFRTFAQALDEWARSDPGILKHFGGESLRTKSHGQCHMAYFNSRYKIKGLYFLDEPENALSPKKQLELLKVIKETSQAGHAQFLIASHSPILLALPGADIYSFDYIPVKQVEYENTDYYQIYKNFMNDKDKYI